MSPLDWRQTQNGSSCITGVGGARGQHAVGGRPGTPREIRAQMLPLFGRRDGARVSQRWRALRSRLGRTMKRGNLGKLDRHARSAAIDVLLLLGRTGLQQTRGAGCSVGGDRSREQTGGGAAGERGAAPG